MAYRKPKSPTEAALQKFAEEWQALPPLIRAGLAHSIAKWAAQGVASELHEVDLTRALGLERRPQVRESFSMADRVVQRLFVALCNAADAEAVARGIDEDVK